jgi:hypothetical protein
MFGEQRTRTLLGPADPARNTAIAPPRLSARDLIARAEATAEPVVGRRHARPTRRLVLTTGAVAVAAAATAVIHTFDASTVDRPKTDSLPGAQPGTVLVPAAYQFDSGASPAGTQLRALADMLVNAPYDNHTGRYTYHHVKRWGDPVAMSPDRRYIVGQASEQKVWQAADGTGKQIITQLEPEYPDQASRDYWQRKQKATTTGTPAPITEQLPPLDLAPLPSDRAQLSELLKVRFGAAAVSKEISTVYGRYVVARQTRAEILRVLAGVPGFLWRGEVTDRAGRKGVAITFDDREHDAQSLLIFDPNTGELLAHERLTLSPIRISAYQMILGTDWTNQLG